MSVLIFALIVILVLGLLIWAIERAPAPIPPVAKWAIEVILVLIGAILILQKSGVSV